MLNKWIGIGNLVTDPELKYTEAGTARASFRVAVTRTFNREESDFFHVTAWKNTAELCPNYLKKGSQVCIEGRMQSRQYENKDGQKRTAIEIVADQVHFLGGKPQAQQGQQTQQSAPAQQDSLEGWEQLGKMADDDSEIPF